MTAVAPRAPAAPPRPYQSYLYAYPHKTAYRPLAPRPGLRGPVGGRAAGRAVPLRAHAVLRDALRLLQPVHPDRRARRADRPPTSTRWSGRPPRSARRSATTGPRFADGGVRRRHPHLPDRRRAGPAVRHRRAGHGRRPAGRPAVGRDLAGHRDRRPAGRARRPRRDPAQHRRAELRRRRGARRRSARSAAPRSRRRWPGSATPRVPVLNIDLIYGIDGQTAASWRSSLDAALAWQPEELYLYPLYVRPLTGLGRPRDPRPGRPRTGTTSGCGCTGGPRPPARRTATSRCRCGMFRRAGRAAAGGPDYSPARTTAWSAWAAAPARTPPRCTTPSTTRSAMREVRAIIDDYLARPPRTSRVAEFGRSARRRRAAPPPPAPVAAPGRRARRGRLPGTGSAPTPAEDFRRELDPARRARLAGAAPAPAGCGSPPRGWPTPTRIGPGLFSPRCARRMAAYELK